MTHSKTMPAYRYADGSHNCSHDYLLPVLRRELNAWRACQSSLSPRLFDLGCGNGSVGAILADDGWSVTGVDPSPEGIAAARSVFPQIDVHQGSAYDDLASEYGGFPVVISLEVVEHVYAPRAYASTLFDLVEPGGKAYISTPFHGYFKNLALALSGRMDAHFTALWDSGHIKFWSHRTLGQLLSEAGFTKIRFVNVGRVPPLAKSMIAIAKKVD